MFKVFSPMWRERHETQKLACSQSSSPLDVKGPLVELFAAFESSLAPERGFEAFNATIHGVSQRFVFPFV